MPLAVSLADHEMMEERERARSSSERSRSSPLPLEISESEQSPIKSLKEGSRAMSLSPGGKSSLLIIILVLISPPPSIDPTDGSRQSA